MPGKSLFFCHFSPCLHVEVKKETRFCNYLVLVLVPTKFLSIALKRSLTIVLAVSIGDLSALMMNLHLL